MKKSVKKERQCWMKWVMGVKVDDGENCFSNICHDGVILFFLLSHMKQKENF